LKVSLRSILEPQQFIIPDQNPEADGNYIISGPPPPLVRFTSHILFFFFKKV